VRSSGPEIPRDGFPGGHAQHLRRSVTFLDLDSAPKSHQSDFRDDKEDPRRGLRSKRHERSGGSNGSAQSVVLCRDIVRGRPGRRPGADAARVRQRLEACACRPERADPRSVSRRRSFLILTMPGRCGAHGAGRIMSAPWSVCEGINMQYLLSSVDSRAGHCGTKIAPQTSRPVGSDGRGGSDLRRACPGQGVETSRGRSGFCSSSRISSRR